VVKELGMEAEQVLGAVVRLEEGIGMEEDSGDLSSVLGRRPSDRSST
jgi:hypothetical protein